MEGAKRELCPDGACIGLIGPDGFCKECGMSAEAAGAAAAASAAADENEDQEWDEDLDDEDLDDDEDDGDGEDWDDDYDEDDDDLDDDDDDLDDDDDDLDDDDDDLDDDDDGAVDTSGFDESHRELCPDGSCIGVIGADGLCKECGTPGRSARLDPRQRGMLTDAEMEEEEDDGEDLDIAVSTPLPADHDFKSRKLCPDGACIGVIGKNGRCKECGKRA